MAPEVHQGLYDSKCDTWSLGVLLYVFMSGYLPFQGSNRQEVFDKIQRGKYHFDHEEFKVCSNEVIDLIKKLLVVDPNHRLSASQALKHPWF
jgi:calcium-dependent protein kinase